MQDIIEKIEQYMSPDSDLAKKLCPNTIGNIDFQKALLDCLGKMTEVLKQQEKEIKSLKNKIAIIEIAN